MYIHVCICIQIYLHVCLIYYHIYAASLKQCGSRPGDGFMQEEASRLYDDPSKGTCTSFCHKQNGHDKMGEEHLYSYATTTEGTGAEKCPGLPMAYETPQPLNGEKNQEFWEYSTLKH